MTGSGGPEHDLPPPITGLWIKIRDMGAAEGVPGDQFDPLGNRDVGLPYGALDVLTASSLHEHPGDSPQRGRSKEEKRHAEPRLSRLKWLRSQGWRGHEEASN
jgi:hypothetical protein